MQKNMFEQEMIIVMSKTTSRLKLRISKAFALALHVVILFAGTSLAEYGWRYWGGHY
jgi:TRAP-type C4-dicarboxylate transport system permease small subunit